MMVTQTRTRYPGAQPFSDDAVSRKLFYGREQESTALTHQILANRLVVLFARSGLGKTSLLNAGVADQLRTEHYLPLSVRVNDSAQGPLGSIYQGIEHACQNQSIEYVPGDKISFWHFFKSAQFWGNDILLTPTLILDQFEELFTLHTEPQRADFLDQLSYLVRGVRPKDTASESTQYDEQESMYSNAAPVIKIIISLREDFLAQLEEISDRIPEILDQRFRLLPLGREAAAKALEVPAGIEDPSLDTQPFKIDPEARASILDFLEHRATDTVKRSASNIEPFQLQLICQHAEEIAQQAQHKGAQSIVTVGIADIGGEKKLRKILLEFFKRQVAAVPSFFQRRCVLKMCSEHLINPQGRRLRMEESEIHRITRVKPKTLQILVDRRLLRRDQSIEGNYYELSHDSLIIPVVDSVRVKFYVRAAALLMLTLVGLITFILAGIPFLSTFGAESNFDREWIFVALIASTFLWVVGRWMFRNYCAFTEMWRRSRI